jgi:hypothetical protein
MSAKTYDNAAYTWYNEVLHTPRHIMAPMVGQSELAFRVMVKKNGCDMAFTQMHHAYNFMRDPKYRETCIDWTDYSAHNGRAPAEARESEALDGPIIAQFAGDDPDVVVAAAEHVLTGNRIAGVDLNLGCPQRIAKRGNYGAYLAEDTDKVISVLSAMVTRLDCPVSAKVRTLSTPFPSPSPSPLLPRRCSPYSPQTQHAVLLHLIRISPRSASLYPPDPEARERCGHSGPRATDRGLRRKHGHCPRPHCGRE